MSSIQMRHSRALSRQSSLEMPLVSLLTTSVKLCSTQISKNQASIVFTSMGHPIKLFWIVSFLIQLFCLKLIVLCVLELGSVEGVAYEKFTNQIFWTCTSDATINSFLLDSNTSKINNIVHLGSSGKPRGIALDACSE